MWTHPERTPETLPASMRMVGHKLQLQVRECPHPDGSIAGLIHQEHDGMKNEAMTKAAVAGVRAHPHLMSVVLDWQHDDFKDEL